MASPMELSLKRLNEQGYWCEKTEHWVKYPGRMGFRKDLFGFCDILALKEGEVLVVQTTARSCMNARVKKITEHENLPFVRKAGIRVEVHGWFKNKAGKWDVKVIDMS